MKKNEVQILINKKGAKQQRLRKDVPFLAFLLIDFWLNFQVKHLQHYLTLK